MCHPQSFRRSTQSTATLFSTAKKHLLTALLPFLALCAMLGAAPVWAEGVIATVAVENAPRAVAANPATNNIYVANQSGSVTVIDGVTNSTSTVAMGSNPIDVAVNTATNKIYVTNIASNTVTVIDGASNSTTTVAVGDNTSGIVINPVTNRIYVTNWRNDTVSVIGELDTIAPALAMPALSSSYTVGSTAMLTFAATDTESQIASVTATLNGIPVSSGSTVVLNQLGTNTFILTATDTAGNTATQSLEFTVIDKTGGLHSQSTCNQGVGNGSEGCDPGNSYLSNPFGSNDENGGTPGNPGRKGGNK